jgi:hypothetical protein
LHIGLAKSPFQEHCDHWSRALERYHSFRNYPLEAFSAAFLIGGEKKNWLIELHHVVFGLAFM